MLAAVLSDGTAVNIVKRGDDIVRGERHFVTVMGDNGAVYKLCANLATEGGTATFSVVDTDGVITLDTNNTQVSVDGVILVFDSTSDLSYPEVLDWLCRNYGLSFSPVGLTLWDGTAMLSVVQGTQCYEVLHGRSVWSMLLDDDEFYCLASSGRGYLSCNGNWRNIVDIPIGTVDYAPLSYIRGHGDYFTYAFTTWLFYLSSGLSSHFFSLPITLYAYNDNGEDLFLLGKDSDFVVSDGRKFVCLQGSDGYRYYVSALFYDDDEIWYLFSEDNSFYFAPANDSIVAEIRNHCDGSVRAIDMPDAEFPNAHLVYWLMQSYGFTFNPIGLPLWGEGAGTERLASITSAACYRGCFTLFDGDQSFALQYPFGQNVTMLGCDGSAATLDEQTDVVGAYIDRLSAGTFALRKPAFNAWVFWLASGLDQSLFREP